MADEFSWTPLEAQPVARAIASFYRAKHYGVTIEGPFECEGDRAPYRPTISAKDGELLLLVEAQGSPSYTQELQNLAQSIRAHRLYGKLYVATGVGEARLSTKSLRQMKKDGVGLLLVEDDGVVDEHLDGANPHLMVSLPPQQTYGGCKQQVQEILSNYNSGQRLGACREIAELVEELIGKLALKAARSGLLERSEADMEAMEQGNRIDVLAAGGVYSPGHAPLIDANLKHDLQSFRGARNTFDHAPTTKRDRQRREQQFPERLVSGARLVSELVRLVPRAKP